MQIYMRFPEGRKKALTFSYDDGVEQDIRLVSIMKKHGLKGTFNVNSGRYAPEGTVYPEGQIHRRMTREQVTELFKDSGMEVAVHGLMHPSLDKLSVQECVYDVVKDRENLEEQFGKIIRGMAYAYGGFNDEVVTVLKSLGIAYSRTVISNREFRIPTDWLRLEATCHHKDPKLMALAEQFLTKEPLTDPWLFYVWGHSYEFEADRNWNVIEEFAEYIGGQEEVWYATNIEIYEYTEAFRSLVYSTDKRKVYNPSARTVFFETDEKLYRAVPGETVMIKSCSLG